MKKESLLRINATGEWYFIIESDFQVLNNYDSVQAIHGTRIVYVSSLRVNSGKKPTPAGEIYESGRNKLSTKDRVSFIGQSVKGEAEITNIQDKWCLRGFMCADGTIATCVIDFQNPDDQDWAINVWKSLSC